MFAYLFAAFSAITVAAEHLAVACDSASAFYPRGNMVGFRDFDVEGSAADSALAALPLIDLAARIGIKSADTEVVNVAIENIGKDTGFLLYIGVCH